MALNEAWLDQVHEDAIDAAYPIIDPHHHLWPMRPVRGYEYLDDALHRDFTAGQHKVAQAELHIHVGINETLVNALVPTADEHRASRVCRGLHSSVVQGLANGREKNEG